MKSSRAIPWSIGIAVILVAITACAYWMIFVAPIKTSREILKNGHDVLQVLSETLNFKGTMTVNKTVVIHGDRELTELAICEKNITHTHEMTHRWMGSTKKITLQGRFRGKAGYDLTGQITDPANPWGIDVSEDGKIIIARMPKPSILSVEMTDYKIVEDSNGIWNKISKQDRENSVNALSRGARSELEKSGILEEVDASFFQQIKDALDHRAPSGLEVTREPIP